MAPKPEAEIARSHLEKARVEANQKDLARLLNEERKAVFYEGEDPDLGDLSIDEVLEDLLTMLRSRSVMLDDRDPLERFGPGQSQPQGPSNFLP